MSSNRTSHALPVVKSSIWQYSRGWEVAFVSVIIAVGCSRIVSTYHQLSQTFDEPAHVACGLELLEHHTYRYETQHPPLARIMAALPLFLTGVHGQHQPDMWREGNSILHEGDYVRNLELSRLGTLPFFIVGCIGTYLLACQTSNRPVPLLAVALFSVIPPVLGHAGLATTDMAATAGVVSSVACWCYWLGKPSLWRSLLLGVILGLSFLTKFSVIPFVGLSMLLILVLIATRQKNEPNDHFSNRTLGLLMIVIVATLTVMWAGYGFSWHSITNEGSRPHQLVSRVFSSHPGIYEIANRIVEAPVPLSEVFQGLTYVGYHLKNGHLSFLLGKTNTNGTWLFFPVALLVKTPLPFLCLMLLGTILTIGTMGNASNSWLQSVPLISAIAILMVCIPSSINIGIRHILPLFPFLSVLAAQGTVWLFRRKSRSALVFAGAGALLVGWLLTSSLRAGPEYIAYFNELASRSPESVLVESDLDWGQDIDLLSQWCRNNHVPHLWIAYFGSADLTRHQLPPFDDLPPFEPQGGFVAVSLTRKQMGLGSDGGVPQAGPGGYRWLDSYKPITSIGKSIQVYECPRPTGGSETRWPGQREEQKSTSVEYQSAASGETK